MIVPNKQCHQSPMPITIGGNDQFLNAIVASGQSLIIIVPNHQSQIPIVPNHQTLITNVSNDQTFGRVCPTQALLFFVLCFKFSPWLFLQIINVSFSILNNFLCVCSRITRYHGSLLPVPLIKAVLYNSFMVL